MTYTLTHNPEFNSIEIFFDGKPAAEVREALKGLKFRWHGVKKCWYGKAEEAAVIAALNSEPAEGGTVQNSPRTVPAIPEQLKQKIREEYARVWKNDGKMIDFCCKKISRAIKIEDEKIFIWEKPSIETHFCFGESGYDYAEAQNMAAHARTSEQYFKRENLKDYDAIIEALAGNGKGYYYNRTPYIRNESYYRTGELSLCKLAWFCPSELERATEDEKNRIRLMYENELEAILEGYKAERATFEKRLDAYLKRYGLSKIHSWTYWRDA